MAPVDRAAAAFLRSRMPALFPARYQAWALRFDSGEPAHPSHYLVSGVTRRLELDGLIEPIPLPGGDFVLLLN